MCEKHALPGLGAPLQPAVPSLSLLVASASRRLKLWELGTNSHCPVVGTCLPLAVLRRIASRFEDTAALLEDDYVLHSQVVAQCAWRSPLTEALQAELEHRHALAVRTVQSFKSESALQAYWEAERDGAELGAALWACLTHARCGGLLAKRILGEIHMLQHQLGSRDRVELARLSVLENRNAELLRSLDEAKERVRQLSEDRALSDRHRSSLELELATAATRNRSLEARLAKFEGEGRREDPRLAEQAARIRQLERALDKLKSAAAPLPEATLPQTAGSESVPAELETSAGAKLDDKAVLCVGGRPSAVPTYRKLVEGQGGRFLHHDGGTEESTARLEASLSAADLVICQTGCISHSAYWRVKDHCRRTGKRCVFVDKPSAAGLARGLQKIAVVSQD